MAKTPPRPLLGHFWGAKFAARRPPGKLLGVSWPQDASLTLLKRSPDPSWDTLGGEVRGQNAPQAPLGTFLGAKFAARRPPGELLGVSWRQDASLTLKKRSPGPYWDILGGAKFVTKRSPGALLKASRVEVSSILKTKNASQVIVYFESVESQKT